MTEGPQGLRAGYDVVASRIDAAAARAGRAPSSVTLVAASKTIPADVLAKAAASGIRVLGENRAQELAQKAAVLSSYGIEWHFIGQLQTNKAKLVVGVASLIHSVDRFGLAEAIARRARSLGIVQDVLIQVNVAGERVKGGAEPARTVALARDIAALEGARVRGLMTMPPASEDPEASRPHLRALAELSLVLRSELPDADQLSMGMTSDLEIAVEEGATIVRVGRAIFGSRAVAGEGPKGG